MIEIIILCKLCTRIGEEAQDKSRRAIGYQLLMIFFWFGGQIGTAFLCAVVLVLMYGDAAEEYFLWAYLAALIGAATGAWLALRIVARLPDPDSIESDNLD